MKIYCNTIEGDEQLQIFRDCIDKKLWVKCENLGHKYRKYEYPYLYVRPKSLEKDNWGGWVVRGDWTAFTDSPTAFTYSTDRLDISTGTGIRICDPIETFTTQELFNIDAEFGDATFRKLVNKDYWVLVESPRFDEDSYIKILEISDSTVRVEAIPQPCVDFNFDDYMGEWRLAEHQPSSHFAIYNLPLSEIKVVSPLDVMSGEELSDAIAVADSVYLEEAQAYL